MASPLLVDQSSSTASLTSSSYTTSSLSTVWGPGTLSGKAIKALGTITLRGIQAIIIRRKINAISTRFRPKKSYLYVDDSDALYRDLLELCRVGLYGVRVRQSALRIILIQISTGHTQVLARSIAQQWPQIEIHLFLLELVACLPDIWAEAERDKMHLELQTVYLISASHRNCHAASGFIEFIVQLASQSALASEVILDVGFLDILMFMAISDFVDPTPPLSYTEHRQNKLDLIAQCDRALTVLASHPGNVEILATHPLHILWPGEHWKDSFLQMGVSSCGIPLERLGGTIWGQLSETMIKQRLSTIEDILDSQSGVHYGMTSMLHVCCDLVELCSVTLYGTDIADRSLSALLRCIALGGDVWKVMRCILASRTSEKATQVLSRMISCLKDSEVPDSPLSYSSEPTTPRSPSPTSSSQWQYLQAISRNKTVHPIDYFLEFSANLARGSKILRRAILKAGVVSLIRSVLGDVTEETSSTYDLTDATGSGLSPTIISESLHLYNSILAEGVRDSWTEINYDQNRALAVLLAQILSQIQLRPRPLTPKARDSTGTISSVEDVDRVMNAWINTARAAVSQALPDVEASALLASSRKFAGRDRDLNDAAQAADDASDQHRLLICYQVFDALFSFEDDSDDGIVLDIVAQ